MNRPSTHCFLYFGFHRKATCLCLLTSKWAPLILIHINFRLEPLLQAFLQKNFTLHETAQIIAGANTSEYKQKLMDITKYVVEKQGAFGCPWFWVTNEEGKGEPFFGSDRYVVSF